MARLRVWVRRMNIYRCCTRTRPVDHLLHHIMALHSTFRTTPSIHAGQRPTRSGNGLKSDKLGLVQPDAVSLRPAHGEVAAFECLGPAVLWQRLRDGLFTLEASLILLHWLQRHSLVR